MLADRQVTCFDHGGAVWCEETDGQLGSPERLRHMYVLGEWHFSSNCLTNWTAQHRTYLMLVTSQFLATAALHIRLPRKPLPPQTTSLFFAAPVDIAASKSKVCEMDGSYNFKSFDQASQISTLTSPLSDLIRIQPPANNLNLDDESQRRGRIRSICD